MDDIIISVILGIVEGLTEFLPVSSTGHLIILNSFLDFTGAFADTFDIVIQFGAILAVLVYFRGRLNLFANGKVRPQALELWKKALVGFIPAAVIGATGGIMLQKLLFNPYIVAVALLVGGVALIWVECRKMKANIPSVASLSYRTAFTIGLIQCLAFIPGTSRSAATILGAMALGCSRIAAAEYSFYLAIPTMAAASGYSLLKAGVDLSGRELLLLGVGFSASFLVAWAVIAGFMDYVTIRDFKIFGYYRIILGLTVLAYYLA
ncbi:MAG: undecaprenyl-diphosphate phosphatase [Candidatus Altiarchaeota archaeon]